MTTQDTSSKEKQVETARVSDPQWEPPEDWRSKLILERLDKAFDFVTPFPGVEHDRGVNDALIITLYQLVLEIDIIRRELAWARHSRTEASL